MIYTSVRGLKYIVPVFFFTVIFHGNTAASDSSLMERRIAKISALAEDLSSIQFTERMIKGDSAAVALAYGAVFQKYFPRKVVTQEFNMLYTLGVFHHLRQKIGLDSTAFAMPDPAKENYPFYLIHCRKV